MEAQDMKLKALIDNHRVYSSKSLLTLQVGRVSCASLREGDGEAGRSQHCKAACHQFGLTTPVQILGNRKFTPDLLEGESTKTKKSSGGKGRPGEGC
uniref:Uncharacterized protein n=1 Tax=Oryza punctata TaxID=4537 RepID=A0A0E0JXT5_ORYPU